MRTIPWKRTTGLAACITLALIPPASTAAAAPMNTVGVTTGPVTHPVANDRLLRHGQRGEDVRQWQSVLNRATAAGVLTHPRLVEDGIFGSNTTGATLALQRRLGIVQDGIVGPVTGDGVGGLIDGTSGPGAGESADDRLLRFGMRGDDVKGWQQGINRVVAAGRVEHPVIAEDGVFGENTRSATRAVQRVLGVSPDGIVGPITRDGVAGVLDS